MSFRFYSYGLEKLACRIPRFEEFTMLDYKSGSLYGLEKFWAFHYCHCGENRPTIREILRNFSTPSSERSAISNAPRSKWRARSA